MSDQYFIRIRGKVQGPFEADKLRQLARRGQFSRLHEVSADGTQWQTANAYAELFSPPATSQVAAAPQIDLQPPVSSTAPSSGTSRSEVWYYGTGGGDSLGPVDFLRLSSLIESKQLSPDVQVWREGMPDWAPAHAIPGLVRVAPSFNDVRPKEEPEFVADAKPNQISPTIARVLEESRPWILFIVVIVFIYAALTFVGGFVQLTFAARTSDAPMMAVGLIQMVFSVVIALGGYFLLAYARGIARFDRNLREDSLRSALESLKLFWCYVGIVLIVLLVLIVLAVLAGFAALGSLPHFNRDL